MSPFAAFAISLVAALACVVLAWRARRWRRAGGHPHCRRCDFDLTGLPADAARCPECGAELAAPRATVVGEKRPARFVQAAAAVVAIACAAGTLHFGRRVDWVAHRVRLSPTAWLIEDVRPPVTATHLQTLAAAELERRLYATPDADTRQIESIVRALRPTELMIRPSARAGDAVPVGLLMFGVPLDANWSASGPTLAPAGVERPYWVEARCARASLGDGPPLPPGRFGTRTVALRQTNMRSPQTLTLPPDAPVGPARVRVTYAFRASRGTVDGPASREAEAVEWEQTFDLPLIVLPAEAIDDVTLVRDEGLRAGTLAAVKRPRGVRVTREQGRAYARCDWFIAMPPVGVAFDVVLRSGDAELPVGTLAAGPRQNAMTGSCSLPADSNSVAGWRATTADVVLRPSPAAARGSLDLTTIWGDEVVFRDVPVSLPPPEPHE